MLTEPERAQDIILLHVVIATQQMQKHFKLMPKM